MRRERLAVDGLVGTAGLAKRYQVTQEYVPRLARQLGVGRKLPAGIWVFTPADIQRIDAYFQAATRRPEPARCECGTQISGRHHSQRCVRCNNRHHRQAFLAELERHGLHGEFVAMGESQLSAQVSERLGYRRSPAYVSTLARSLTRGELFKGVWLYVEPDVVAVVEAIAGNQHPFAQLHRDAEWRPRWYFRRTGSKDEWRRFAPAIAARRGKQRGRPRGRAVSQEEVDRIVELHKKGLFSRAIARVMGIGYKTVQRVLADEQSA